MKVQVAKWGNSTAVRLPKAVVRQLGLAQGMVLDISVEQGVVRLEREDTPGAGLARPTPLTLDWIVSEIRRLGPENEPGTLDWGADVGSEVVDDDIRR